MTLAELGQKHHTDKFEHGYCPHYEHRFADKREESVTLLEIGTWQGASLRMWREYFSQGKIVGIDHAPEWMPGPHDGIVVERGDQTNAEFVRTFARRYGPFDFIVDDGGHRAVQHVASFQLLWDSVKPSGWYCIEDLHSLYNICWTNQGDATIFDILYPRTRNILVGGDSIVEVDIVGGNWNDGLVCIRKRHLPYTPERPP